MVFSCAVPSLCLLRVWRGLEKQAGREGEEREGWPAPPGGPELGACVVMLAGCPGYREDTAVEDAWFQDCDWEGQDCSALVRGGELGILGREGRGL